MKRAAAHEEMVRRGMFHVSLTDYPLTGAPNADMISVKRVNAKMTETTWKKDGKTVMKTRGVLSGDGKTRTVTFDGTDPQGRKVHNVVVYEKES